MLLCSFEKLLERGTTILAILLGLTCLCILFYTGYELFSSDFCFTHGDDCPKPKVTVESVGDSNYGSNPIGEEIILQFNNILCNSSTTMTDNENPLCQMNCSNPLVQKYIGDGYCDDIFNLDLTDCLFDGGDCCGSNVNTMFCDHCQCLEDVLQLDESCIYQHGLGNGICEDFANIAECEFDHGDCCLPQDNEFCYDCSCNNPFNETNVNEMFKERIRLGLTRCTVKNLEPFQDGHCHDELNNQECRYDGGDCCLDTVLTNVCDQCLCKEPDKIVSGRDQSPCLVNGQLPGVCQDEFNTPQCNYDNGDCCGSSDLTWCDICKCLDPRIQEVRDIKACEFSPNKGDGICQDGNNIAECSWDGGDCCGCGKETRYCSDCQCRDPSYPKELEGSKTCCDFNVIFNGYCDGRNDINQCLFDGYDCCEGQNNQECQALKAARTIVNLPGGKCSPELMSDSVCDLRNNMPMCYYDGGDCDPDTVMERAILYGTGRKVLLSTEIFIMLSNGQVLRHLPAFPTPVENAEAFSVGNEVYILGGTDDTGNLLSSMLSLDLGSSMDRYSLWSLKSSMLQRRQHFGSTLLGDESNKTTLNLWVTGGMTSSGVMIQQSEIYNLDMDQWTIGPALRVGGHCMVTLNQDEVLITGGFRDNRITLTTTISYNLNNEGLPDQEMLKGNYMNPRMFHACGKIWLPDWNTYAAIMVGGLDQNGDEVTLTELYYPNIGQWVATTHLPGPLSYASAVNVYDRLLISGGLSGLTPMDLALVLDPASGWHVSTYEMDEPRFSHIAVSVNYNMSNTKALDDNEMPNFLIAQGTGGSHPETLCLSKMPNSIFGFLCSSEDEIINFMGSRTGSVTALKSQNRGQVTSNILVCGGVTGSNQVSGDCSSLENQADGSIKLIEKRSYAASVQMANGHWLISGGFQRAPYPEYKQLHPALGSVEGLNGQVYQILHPLASHCFLHLAKETFMFVGGLTANIKVGSPLVYIQDLKTGTTHRLPDLKLGRSNHACFVREVSGSLQVVVAGGRHWIQPNDLDLDPIEQFTSSVEILELNNTSWTSGPNLPNPLAFASVVDTPKGSWVFGGRTDPNNDQSMTSDIFMLMEDYWFKVPYKMSRPRSDFVAAALNVPNYRERSPLDLRSLMNIWSRRSRDQSKQGLVIMDGLDVIDIPVKMIKGDLKMDLNGAQTLNPWIHDADGSHGGFWRNYLIVFGGGRQGSTSVRLLDATHQEGLTTVPNHLIQNMPRKLTQFGFTELKGKFWIAGGKNDLWVEQEKTWIFDDQGWNVGPDLFSTVSGSCLVALDGQHQGLVIGGSSNKRDLRLVYMYDFTRAESRAYDKVAARKLNSLNTPRRDASCGMIQISKEEPKRFVIIAGGSSNEFIASNMALSSVEAYDSDRDEWFYLPRMPRSLTGGRIIVISNQLLHFGGQDNMEDTNKQAFRFMPYPPDFTPGGPCQETLKACKSRWDYQETPQIYEGASVSPVLIYYQRV